MSQPPATFERVDERRALGRAGEDLAARLYARLGCNVIDRNWRCAQGEIDLVALDGRVVVFCEVKARRSSDWGEPSEAVDWRKQARLRRLAGRWLAEHRPRARGVRFDVVAVTVSSGRARVDHIPDAF